MNEELHESHAFIASAEEEGARLDRVLADRFPESTRSYLQKLIQAGDVSINDKTAKASTRLTCGDLVAVSFPEPETLDVRAEAIPLDILYEDDDLLIVTKQCVDVSLRGQPLRNQRCAAARYRAPDRSKYDGFTGRVQE